MYTFPGEASHFLSAIISLKHYPEEITCFRPAKMCTDFTVILQLHQRNIHIHLLKSSLFLNGQIPHNEKNQEQTEINPN